MMEFQLTDVSLTAGQAITFFKSRGDDNPGTELRLTSDAVSGALTLGFYYNGTAICEGLAFQEGVVYRAAYQYANGATASSDKGHTYLTNTETGEFIYDRLTSNQVNGIMGGDDGKITGKMYTNDQLTISVSGGYNFWNLGGKEHIDTFKAYATFAVPEPTTATLSLLALAGLAARRRRK